MIRACFPSIASLLSFVQGSSADSTDVDIQLTQRGVLNDDKLRLVQVFELLGDISPS